MFSRYRLDEPARESKRAGKQARTLVVSARNEERFINAVVANGGTVVGAPIDGSKAHDFSIYKN